MSDKQMLSSKLSEEQNRDRLIRGAFLGTAAALPARPVPVRTIYDNVGRSSCPSSPWRSVQEAMRATAVAAARDGRPVVVEETRARLEAFYATLGADAMAALPDPVDNLGLVQAALNETASQCQLDPVQQEVVSRPTCRAAVQLMVERARIAIRDLQVLVRRGERFLAGASDAGRVRAWR